MRKRLEPTIVEKAVEYIPGFNKHLSVGAP
jgi:hypothetical protein